MRVLLPYAAAVYTSFRKRRTDQHICFARAYNPGIQTQPEQPWRQLVATLRIHALRRACVRLQRCRPAWCEPGLVVNARAISRSRTNGLMISQTQHTPIFPECLPVIQVSFILKASLKFVSDYLHATLRLLLVYVSRKNQGMPFQLLD